MSRRPDGRPRGGPGRPGAAAFARAAPRLADPDRGPRIPGRRDAHTPGRRRPCGLIGGLAPALLATILACPAAAQPTPQALQDAQRAAAAQRDAAEAASRTAQAAAAEERRLAER
ncbi:hypothetical protein, partial [Paracraurococcus ruber]|uniref:hypothetical protein n=1 Tax=Paracraurococcus ruber TaxID=77675 RepID=UPI0019616F5A